MSLTTPVVIRTLNEAEHIGKLLAGLEQQTRRPKEIIVVDSGSTDATVEIAERFGARIVTIEPQDFTFGRSLNLGCEAATGDVLLIASAHVYPLYDNWIESMVAPFEDDDSISLTYGRQVGDSTTRFSEQQVLTKWFPAESRLPQDHPFCNNANAAVRHQVWESTAYNENLTGLEDLDWAKRTMEAGLKVGYVAEATVAHVHRESFAQVKNRYRREAIAHRQIFPAHGMGRLEAVRIAVASIASDYALAARSGRLSKNLLDVPSFRLAQFLGSYQGFQQRGPIRQSLLKHFYYPAGIRQPRVNPDGSKPGNALQYEGMEEEPGETYAA